MSEANRAVFVGEGTLLIRCAQAWRDAGQRVTGEVSPHHLLLTDDLCEGYNTQAKMNQIGRASCRERVS